MLKTSTARRAGSLVAGLGVMLAMFLVASPAQAALGVELTTNHTSITQGDSITLEWASTDATSLQASGDSDWTGAKNASGTQVITPSVGSHTYTLTATDASGGSSADSVTVNVTAAAPGPITPNAVTFPDDCTVVIPTTANVTYFVDFGDGDIQELDAGTYDGADLSGGDAVDIFAQANDGFILADVPAHWSYTAPDSCFDGPPDEGPDYVTTTVDCGSVTFTNTTDTPIGVLYGSGTGGQPDGSFTLAAGASHTLKTKHAEFAFLGIVIGADEETPEQFRIIDVPQDCDGGSGDGDGSDHPTTAPAAGITAR